jgi:hypothetical protein
MRVRLHSFRSRALLACVPAVSLALMASAGTASASHTPATTRTDLRTALEHLLTGWHPTNYAVRTRATGTGLKKAKALNWSGYADTGSGFSSVAGTWTVPKVTGCSATGPEKIEIFWVGIDGFNDQTVEQDGTGAACGKGVGALTYFTWWETLPPNPIEVVGATVKPGDEISASVVRKGTKYTLKVTDSTTSGNSFSTTQACTAPGGCDNASAEWIAERAAFENTSTGKITFSDLPDFGTWTLSNGTATAGSTSGTISSFPDNEITMINKNTGGHDLAKPGALNSAGNSFTDTWKASS